ncbi:serine/threonine-protein kinase [Chitinophaga rhizophila]|uniref:Serine/threonine protein kinase n=1 Tax=Chitinophaga rhizophila TaxID=2866212 RepID=A0ABS7GC14_9BACT|nr:serine/threonine-protein kinase [Chitinophaga rhizophila]MBW8685210.1 serine/threonine protein kinase [Chitinophaga rhizophila]
MTTTVTSTSLGFSPICEIGKNGKNSEVFKATDIQLNCIIAVKRVAKSKIPNPNEFFVEARILNESEHQHVVPIKFASMDNDYIYLGMPYYSKGSLKDLIDSRFLTVREILRYSIQFLSGLNNIHSKKLIHFDIKPDNILISDNNTALVSDFGLAKAMDIFGLSELDQAYYKHLPPEYFKTSKHSMLYDIYSAGLTLYRLCNGNKHFYDQLALFPDRDDKKFAITNGKFPDRSSFKIHIPKKLRKIIKKALSLKPEDRHQTVLELTNELSEINELLDWNYSESQDSFNWNKDDGQRKISISLKKLANSQYELISMKTIVASGNTQKIQEGCKSNLTITDAESIIDRLLTSYE